MYSKTLNKAISILILITFLFTNTNIGYGAPSSKSLFKNKKVDYNKISSQQEDILQKKQSVIKGEDAKELEAQDKASKKILQANLSDISQIHIPQEMGRIVEVYEAPLNESQTTNDERRLIVGIQDLHTNPEAELNLAKILEILLKDYNMGLVCSEGADGVVDTSSISSFPDSRIKEKVSRIFIDSGELTGEEYLSITKYPDLPIWGVEDKDIYFKNIIDFNKIMKFSPDSQRFISQTKKAVEELKPKIYSKELIELDKKELEFSSQKLDTAIYIAYLTNYADKLKLNTANYKNIALLNETTQMEKTIDQLKIMNESSNLILNLQSILMNKSLKSDLDTLSARANLFKDQKTSPFSFYSYLKDLALKHIKEDFAAKYPEFNNFIEYLTKVNSLDSTKLFLELENLNFEIKETIAKTDEQKLLIKASRNINFLENFFNLKVSNEDLDYYLNNREEHKVAFFKSFLPGTLKKYNINTFIDYNLVLIDSHLQELEDFYKTVKDRDIAMVNNSISEITKRDVKLATLVHGGFHTKGITKLLREKNYSYIIVSPYSKTDMDEENYHFLLSGRRKPITELIQKLDLSKIIENLLKATPETLRITLGFDEKTKAEWDAKWAPQIAQIWGIKTDAEQVKQQSLAERMGVALSVYLADRPILLGQWQDKATGKIPIGIVEARKAQSAEKTVILKVSFTNGDSGYFKIPASGEVKFAREDEFGLDQAEAITVAAAAPGDTRDGAVSAMTDTLMPRWLSYTIKQEEVSGLSQVTIYSSMLEGFLDPESDSTKMEGLVERREESLMGFMRKVFETGAEQINNLDSRRRKILLRGLYDLFEQVGKKDITFYLAPEEFVGKGIYMRRVKIEGKDRYGVLINKAYLDAASEVLEKIRVAEKETVLPEHRELMEKAVYYTVFERVMHELLEAEDLLEKALASGLGHPEKGDAIKRAIIEIETNSFINTDAKLYAYLCHSEIAGAIDLVRSLLKDSYEKGDKKLAKTIFGPNRYKKLKRLFDRFSRGVVFFNRPLEEWGAFTQQLTNCAEAFVDATYTGATTTAMADTSAANKTATMDAIATLAVWLAEKAKEKKGKEGDFVRVYRRPDGNYYIYRKTASTVPEEQVTDAAIVQALSIVMGEPSGSKQRLFNKIVVRYNTPAKNIVRSLVATANKTKRIFSAIDRRTMIFMVAAKALAKSEPQDQKLLVENAFVIRADKMQEVDPKQWVDNNRNAHLVILINSLDEYNAVKVAIGDLTQMSERLHLVVLIGGEGLETIEAAEAAKIDPKYLYDSQELTTLFEKAMVFDTPTSINEVVGDRAQAEVMVRQI